MRIYATTITTLSLFLFSSQALARRDQRDGFNFGTTLRVLDETRDVEVEETKTTRSTSTYSVTPFVGYAFSGLFNLGLNSTIESTTSSEQTTREDELRQLEVASSLSGGGLFARLLFGKVMYMEANVGVYRGSTSTTESVQTGESQFTGTSTTTKTSGVGYGYGFGLGLEIPIANGFYFTGAYTTRVLSLQDYKDPLVNTRQNNLKSEFQFGIIHYLR